MFTVEECCRLAEECERDAGRATSAKYREDMLMVARVWRQLAEEREQKRRSAKAA